MKTYENIIKPEDLIGDLEIATGYLANTFQVLDNLFLNHYMNLDQMNKIKEGLREKRNEIEEKLAVLKKYKDKINPTYNLLIGYTEEEIEDARKEAQGVLDWWEKYNKSFFKSCKFNIRFDFWD